MEYAAASIIRHACILQTQFGRSVTRGGLSLVIVLAWLAPCDMISTTAYLGKFPAGVDCWGKMTFKVSVRLLSLVVSCVRQSGVSSAEMYAVTSQISGF